MSALINKSSLITDSSWISLQDATQLDTIKEGARLSCSLTVWKALSEKIVATQPKQIQLALEGNDEIEEITTDANTNITTILAKFSLISIQFNEFKDGRGYSLARLLRERYGYEGELRATGDVTHDQLFYLSRCGFNTFLLRSDQDVTRSLKAFSDFSTVYQAAADEPKPIYQR